MKRKSSRIIIRAKDDRDSIYLIYRKKNGEEYYVTPGGGVEDGESFVDAAKREAMEEIGTELINLQEIDRVEIDNNICAIFVADEKSRTDFTGEELKNIYPNNYYEVQLHKIKNVKDLNLKPDFYQEIIKRLL